jgi:hypothetical protein
MLRMHRLIGKHFLVGMGRTLDLRGASHARVRARRTWHRSDRAAVASDWEAVFGDLGAAFQRVRQSRVAEDA